MSKKRVQFCELYSKNQFLETFFTFQNILCVIFFFLQKSSIQWVIIFEKFRILSIILKKVQFCGSYSRKRFKSLRRIEKKVQFFASFLTKFVLNSLSHILEIRFNFFDWLKKIQFFESCWKTRKVQFFASYWKEGSFLWVKRRVQFCESFSLQKKFDSLSHTQKDSILWIILKKRFNSMSHKKEFNSMSHNSKKRGSILRAMQKKVQFFESY